MNKSFFENENNLGSVAKKFIETIDGWVTITLMITFLSAGVGVTFFNWQLLKIEISKDWGLAMLFYPVLLGVAFIWHRSGVPASQKFHLFTFLNILIISVLPFLNKFGV
jgi:hypothetical protein